MGFVDIVYIFKQNLENDSAELRYSLRSLDNLPHRQVFIVGEKPDWAQNVIFIPVEQNDTKHANVKNSLLTACQFPNISDDFILMNDDFFIMKPIRHESLSAYDMGKMRDVIMAYETRYPSGSDYINNMRKLYKKLLDMGHEDPISYELHIPMVMNKKKCLALEQEFGQIYQRRSAYGNHYHIGGGLTIKDVKIFLDDVHNDPAYAHDPETYLRVQTFLSTNGGSFRSGRAGQFVRSVFSRKSNYEI